MLSICSAFSQGVGISEDGTDPDANAMLDVKSTNKGFLPPRVDLDSAGTIAPLAGATAGMIIYNQGGDEPDGLYMWDGTAWTKLNDQRLSIGDHYGGGIIFWLDASGQHGLIAATADQSTWIPWYNGSYTTTNATLDGVYAGRANTDLIMSIQGAGSYAAQLCDDYSVNVDNEYYDDWYLPSIYELNLLYDQRTLVGGFIEWDYWSSTESSDYTSFKIWFTNGDTGTNFKENNNCVRAVRAF